MPNNELSNFLEKWWVKCHNLLNTTATLSACVCLAEMSVAQPWRFFCARIFRVSSPLFLLIFLLSASWMVEGNLYER